MNIYPLCHNVSLYLYYLLSYSKSEDEVTYIKVRNLQIGFEKRVDKYIISQKVMQSEPL